VAARLAQEELERVGCCLVDDRLRRRLLLLVLDDVDAALLALAVERLGLELAQLVRVDELGQLGGANRTGLLGRFDDLPDVLRGEDVLDLNCHAARVLNTGAIER
jgi:hypothetical protein